MGIVVPRPAMRAREFRIIKARMAYMDTRYAELKAAGDPHASTKAFDEARALQFDRAGKIKKKCG